MTTIENIKIIINLTSFYNDLFLCVFFTYERKKILFGLRLDKYSFIIIGFVRIFFWYFNCNIYTISVELFLLNICVILLLEIKDIHKHIFQNTGVYFSLCVVSIWFHLDIFLYRIELSNKNNFICFQGNNIELLQLFFDDCNYDFCRKSWKKWW